MEAWKSRDEAERAIDGPVIMSLTGSLDLLKLGFKRDFESRDLRVRRRGAERECQ